MKPLDAVAQAMTKRGGVEEGRCPGAAARSTGVASAREQLAEVSLEPFARAAGVFGAVEEAAVDVEGEARGSVPELSADEDDVQSLRDQDDPVDD